MQQAEAEARLAALHGQSGSGASATPEDAQLAAAEAELAALQQAGQDATGTAGTQAPPAALGDAAPATPKTFEELAHEQAADEDLALRQLTDPKLRAEVDAAHAAKMAAEKAAAAAAAADAQGNAKTFEELAQDQAADEELALAQLAGLQATGQADAARADAERAAARAARAQPAVAGGGDGQGGDGAGALFERGLGSFSGQGMTVGKHGGAMKAPPPPPLVVTADLLRNIDDALEAEVRLLGLIVFWDAVGRDVLPTSYWTNQP
jgi:hypothetical protein